MRTAARRRAASGRPGLSPPVKGPREVRRLASVASFAPAAAGPQAEEEAGSGENPDGGDNDDFAFSEHDSLRKGKGRFSFSTGYRRFALICINLSRPIMVPSPVPMPQLPASLSTGV